MKRSEAIEELLDSYYFQHGKSADNRVLHKAYKVIKFLKKEEEKLNQ